MKKIVCIVAILLTLSGCSKQDAQALIWIPAMAAAVVVASPFVSTKANLKEAFPDAPKTQALVKAAEKGDLEKMDTLVADGADVNAKGKGGITVLSWVLAKQNLEGFKHLLKLGADPNATWDCDNLPKFFYVCHSVMHTSRGDFLREALIAGGDPNLEQGGQRKLESGWYWNTNLDELELLESYGLEYSFKTKDGNPFLNQAAYRCGYKLVYHMLKKGVDYSAKDRYGRTLYDIQQNWIIYIGPRGKKWLHEHQKVWFWRCVDFLEEQGYVFQLTPEAEAVRGKYSKEGEDGLPEHVSQLFIPEELVTTS